MSLSLSVTDLANGEGATAVVSGTGGGAWAVWTQPMSSPGAGWTEAASGAGDGTATLAGVGYFFAYLVAGASLSPVVSYAASVAPAAVVCRCRDALLAVLQAKAFPPKTGGRPPRVVAQKAANVQQTGLPAVILSLEGLAESPAGQPWDSERNDLTGYGVGVLIVDASDRLQQDADGYMLWRQIAMLALQNRSAGNPLAGVPELYRTVIEAGPQVESDLRRLTDMPAYMGLGSGFVVRCEAISQRG